MALETDLTSQLGHDNLAIQGHNSRRIVKKEKLKKRSGQGGTFLASGT